MLKSVYALPAVISHCLLPGQQALSSCKTVVSASSKASGHDLALLILLLHFSMYSMCVDSLSAD